MFSKPQCLFILILICTHFTAIFCTEKNATYPVDEPLDKIQLSTTSHIYVGYDLLLDCTAPKHVYDPNITWLIDEEILHADGAHGYTIDNMTITDTEYSSILEVNNLTKHNSGIYECRAERTLGSPAGIFDNSSLHIEVKDVIPPKMNYTTLNDKNITVIEGTFIANLTCVANGEPLPIISWYKDGKKLKHEGEKMMTLKPANSCEFKCVAKNKGGAVSSSIHITVEAKSFFQRYKQAIITFLVVILVLLIAGCSYKLVQKLRRKENNADGDDGCSVPMYEPIFENKMEAEPTKY
ncbi:hypothetical protein B566_EDAN015528 [Ephemera danica]|nr:hypothetical protein B566_EDAN015528 [Ephemera danica]